MKKKSLILVATAITALTMTSCLDHEGPAIPTDNIVRVTASVNELTTRGYYSNSESNLKEFGISIQNPESKPYSYDNIRMTRNQNDSWSAEKVMLWQNMKQPVNILAIAPYKSGTNIIGNSAYPVAVQAEQTKDDNSSDFLIYKETDFAPNTVNVAFSHALSQLVISIKFGTEFDAQNGSAMTESPITDIKVGGTILDGTYDLSLATPALTVGTSAAADVTPYESKDFVQGTGTDTAHEITNAVATYSCILIPQTIAANGFNVSFTINSKTYTWTSTEAVTLQAGMQHSLELTVGDDVTVASQMSAKAWTSTDERSLETD